MPRWMLFIARWSSCTSSHGIDITMSWKRFVCCDSRSDLCRQHQPLVGWRLKRFETHRALSPANRPPHMTQNSTPQEIKAYLKHAGFAEVRIRTDDDWVRASALKPTS